jgi:hypothetical protein
MTLPVRVIQTRGDRKFDPLATLQWYSSSMRAPALVTAMSLVAGCFSSNYVPRDRRKIYMTIQDGKRGYMHNGQFLTEYGFGGSLVEAVAGNPRAEAAANQFRGRMIGGFVATMVGSLCVPAVLGYDLARNIESDQNPPASHGYVLIGCSVLMIGGLIYLTSGLPYQHDAMNIYNDDVDAATQLPPQQWPPPPAPTLPTFAPPPSSPAPLAPPGAAGD